MKTYLRALFVCLAMSAMAASAEEPPTSRGQALYLPIYSHIWHGDLNKEGYPLKGLVSALVSIRNTDSKLPIRILSARYYATDGKLLKEYLPEPRTIPPMATYELYVEKKESAGGSGANFVITWDASTPVNTPIVQALHVDIQGSRTISFLTTARPISQGN